MKHIIYGGTGFIGQNLCRKLLEDGDVVCSVDFDIWSLGTEKLKEDYSETFFSIKYDICQHADQILERLRELGFSGENTHVWHLAANSDISAGNADISIDLKNTFLTTKEVISFSEKLKNTNIYFASSSAVYGAAKMPKSGFSEDSQTLPISNYGAMKLASEALLRAHFELSGKKVVIFRFPNVIGSPATHGVIRDFLLKLNNNPKQLSVLGNGKQCKPYLHVSDLINAMVAVINKSSVDYHLYNVAGDNSNVFVHQIAEKVRDMYFPDAEITYEMQQAGWTGDMPTVYFDTTKIRKFGWQPVFSPLKSVELTINQIWKELFE